MNDIKFVSGGLFVSDGNWIHPKRIIDNTEIIFVLNGELHICEDEQIYHIKKNEALILSPDKLHFGTEYTNELISFYWIHFHHNFKHSVSHYTPSETANLNQLFKMLIHFSCIPNYPAQSLDYMCQLILNELLFICENRNTPLNPLAVKISEYVKNHIGTDITVKSIANYFGYDPIYLGKVFKKSYNMKLKEYINSEKIKFANTLLMNTELPIKEISYALGFKEENLFLKFYIYHEKISPKQYRNIYFNTHINTK